MQEYLGFLDRNLCELSVYVLLPATW